MKNKVQDLFESIIGNNLWGGLKNEHGGMSQSIRDSNIGGL